MKMINPISSGLLLATTLMLSGIMGKAQHKQKYTVAIFIYQGVELLDFAGPAEAFSATPDFTVYTVSIDGKELVSQGFVTVKPQYALDDAPTPDIVVFPGGQVGQISKDEKVLHWANSLASGGTTVMSVCNGAVILAKTGLLNGLTLTSHHSAIDGLRKMLPHSTVLTDTKYVDNGNIITTAGVSSGIDGALHVISRIKGADIAKSVAYYMEYNRWVPEQGLAKYTNEYLQRWGDHPTSDYLLTKTNSTNAKANDGMVNSSAQIPYEGELKNLGTELYEKAKYQDAATVMEQAVKWYPNSAYLYSVLSKSYAKLGKAAPPDQDLFFALIDSSRIDEAISVYEKAKKDFPGWQVFDESALNLVGYRFLRNEDYPKAVKVLLLNTRAFSDSWNAWDSYAEALMKSGNKPEAMSAYKKSLELNPKNDNARSNLAQLASK